MIRPVLAAPLLLLLLGCPADKPGDEPEDADGDGHAVGVDCDDGDADVFPGATERCNGVDDDCSGTADDDPDDGAPYFADDDADGYGAGDALGVACEAPSGTAADDGDCDDADPSRSPGVAEVCDGAVDEDCDELVDDADPDVSEASLATWWPDGDGDGYGGEPSVAACAVPAGHVDTGGDCDDADDDIHPAAAELCDAADADEDCDGLADDADTGAQDPTTWYVDADGDGWGGEGTLQACDAPAGYVEAGGDCDDAAEGSNPDATEVCDPANTDEDCDGLSDDADDSVDATTKSILHVDVDRDGYGDPGVDVAWCDTSAAWVADETDCDDSRATVNPAVATEDCATDYDDDCDGVTNEEGGTACVDWYVDADGDGYGAGTAICACEASGSHATTTAGDCDEAAASTHPGASEVCDEVDQDCDGAADEGLPLYFTDADGDGYGADTDAGTCTWSAAAATVAGDCDDGEALANPGALEVCDDADLDEDCNGLADDDDGGVTDQPDWYPDADLDGYGDETAASVATCDGPAGHVADGTDCDDADDAVSPAAEELYGDSVDEDCDGAVTPSRTYCTPNVGPGRYTTVAAAMAAGLTSICLDAGSYSYSSYMDVPIAGQGMGVSTFTGTIIDDASDLTIIGSTYPYTGTNPTLTRVDLQGSLLGFTSAGHTAYDSIIETVEIDVTAYGSSRSAVLYLYDSWVTGASGYSFDIYANGGGGASATGEVYCFGCTIDAGASGLYSLYATDRGRAYLYLYNSVYEAGTTYTYNGGSPSTNFVSFSTTSCSTATSLLDYAYEPPRPTGALIDAGSTTWGTSTDFWGNTRSGNPDLGAVED